MALARGRMKMEMCSEALSAMEAQLERQSSRLLMGHSIRLACV